MASGEVRRLSSHDLQMVQNLIEHCIQLHMNKDDAVSVLLKDAKIQPGITELVWQRLEQENREFFNVYYLRLALKDQIKVFNELLKKQAALMEHLQSTVPAPMPVSNGCRMAHFEQNAGCYNIEQAGPSTRPESLEATIAASLPFANGSSILQNPTGFNLSTPVRRIDFLPETLHVQSSNSIRFIQGLNGGTIKTESGYPSGSQLLYHSGGNVVDTHAPVEDASVAAFGHVDASSQPLNDPLLQNDSSSFVPLGQIPKTLSFPDLSAYPHLLENYSSSAFGSTCEDNFLDSLDKEEITDENKNLEAISEGYSIEDFGGSE